MILDFAKDADRIPQSHDVCVVGAGAAGISLATELIRLGRRVLLLESGGTSFEQKTQDLYQGEVGDRPYHGLEDGRFRGVGGTTTQWGGQILEMDDLIFTGRPWLNDPGWPFPKAELAPHYARALEIEGLGAPAPSLEDLWRALEADPPQLGPDLQFAFSRWCPETNFSKIHRSLLSGHRDLTVLTHANVCGFELSGNRERVEAVLCRSLTGESARLPAGTFVLTPGGIETSRLLLLPLADGSPPPWNQHDQVGRGYQDHIVCAVATVRPAQGADLGRIFDYASVDGLRYHPKLKVAPSVQADRELLDVCGTITATSKGLDAMALAYETVRLVRTRQFRRLSWTSMFHLLPRLPDLLWHKTPYSRRSPDASKPDRTWRLSVHCEQSPRSEGRVSLSSKTDDLGVPRARVDWKISATELRTIRSFVDLAARRFEQANLGVIVGDDDIGDDQALAARLGESSHHIGGARMAASPELGVVDQNLKLFGVANAYVCGSAVFPAAGFANPTHTVIALASRLAAHLAQKGAGS
jgi:choline dehydrogenase-like flavoprotein